MEDKRAEAIWPRPWPRQARLGIVGFDKGPPAMALYRCPNGLPEPSILWRPLNARPRGACLGPAGENSVALSCKGSQPRRSCAQWLSRNSPLSASEPQADRLACAKAQGAKRTAQDLSQLRNSPISGQSRASIGPASGPKQIDLGPFATSGRDPFPSRRMAPDPARVPVSPARMPVYVLPCPGMPVSDIPNIAARPRSESLFPDPGV